jgi:Skp family chaperone for outer membrane proteins
MNTRVLVAVVAFVMTGCVFADMPTTPTSSAVPVEVADVDGGVSVEELVTQVEKLQEMQRENERLKAKSERLKDELAELQDEARARRARHVEKLGLWANFAMLVVAVGLAALASRRWRCLRG